MAVFEKHVFENYNVEVQDKWGNTDAYKEHTQKTKDYSKQKWDNLAEGLDHIMGEFTVCIKNGDMPDADVAQNLVKMLQEYITENYYSCTKEILSGLGKMYVADERFKNNIDKHGDGTADFINKAITAYCMK